MKKPKAGTDKRKEILSPERKRMLAYCAGERERKRTWKERAQIQSARARLKQQGLPNETKTPLLCSVYAAFGSIVCYEAYASLSSKLLKCCISV